MVKNYYAGKTILVTGYTGFKGSWLCIWLLKLGARVAGYALDPLSIKDNFTASGLSNRMIDILLRSRYLQYVSQVLQSILRRVFTVPDGMSNSSEISDWV